MAYIGKQPLVGNYTVLDSLTATTTDTYALTKNSVAVFPQTPANCIVSLNGVIQAPFDSYTISGSNIVFASALTASDSIDFITVLGDVLNVGTVSDGTIGVAKLSATGTPSSSTFLRGDNTWQSAGGGKVLQVVQGTSITSVSSTSSTYVTTGLSASITPSATSSKILIICNFETQQADSGFATRLTLKRGATDLDPSGDGFAKLRVGASNLFANTPMNYLDSPSTTSSTTYEAFFKSSSGSVEVMAGNSAGVIILIEIGA